MEDTEGTCGASNIESEDDSTGLRIRNREDLIQYNNGLELASEEECEEAAYAIPGIENDEPTNGAENDIELLDPLQDDLEECFELEGHHANLVGRIKKGKHLRMPVLDRFCYTVNFFFHRCTSLVHFFYPVDFTIPYNALDKRWLRCLYAASLCE